MECALVLGRDDPDPKFPVSFSRDQTIPEITTTMASGVVEGGTLDCLLLDALQKLRFSPEFEEDKNSDF